MHTYVGILSVEHISVVSLLAVIYVTVTPMLEKKTTAFASFIKFSSGRLKVSSAPLGQRDVPGASLWLSRWRQ